MNSELRKVFRRSCSVLRVFKAFQILSKSPQEKLFSSKGFQIHTSSHSAISDFCFKAAYTASQQHRPSTLAYFYEISSLAKNRLHLWRKTNIHMTFVFWQFGDRDRPRLHTQTDRRDQSRPSETEDPKTDPAKLR